MPDTALYRQVLTENNFDGARKIEITVPLERLGPGPRLGP